MIEYAWIKWLQKGAWILFGLCLAIALLYAYVFIHLPERPIPVKNQPPPPESPDPQQIPAHFWEVFSGTRGSNAPSETGPLGQRYGLAGTFIVSTGTDPHVGSTMRKAILDDLENKEQHIVEEGGKLGEVELVRVYTDHVTLRQHGRDEDLWLSFSDIKEKTPTKPVAAEPPKDFDDMPALESNRFGKRIGESRWVLYRDDLMKYYEELLEDPERMASIYLSFKPIVNEDVLEGYRMDMAGEELFFKAVGLRNGDVIRRVNSMRMTSQARGEYVFREFLRKNLTAFVFDIERDGSPAKLIYLLR